MFSDIKEGSKLVLRAAIKAVTGFIIIPLGIFVSEIKPRWESADLSTKIFTGIILVPIVVFLKFASPWWEDFKIA